MMLKLGSWPSGMVPHFGRKVRTLGTGLKKSEKITFCSKFASPPACAYTVMLEALPLGWSALPCLAWIRIEERREGRAVGLGAGGLVSGWAVLCCEFELLGSNHDVALPCPRAATLKVLGETHPALCGAGAWAGARAGSGLLPHHRADIWWVQGTWHESGDTGQERDRQSLRCLWGLGADTQHGHLVPSLASWVLLLLFSWLLGMHRGGAALVGLWQLISGSEQVLDK